MRGNVKNSDSSLFSLATFVYTLSILIVQGSGDVGEEGEYYKLGEICAPHHLHPPPALAVLGGEEILGFSQFSFLRVYFLTTFPNR